MRSSQFKALTGKNMTAQDISGAQSNNSGQYIQQQMTQQQPVSQAKSSILPTNQPTTAGGYVVPNVTPQQPQQNYLQPTTSPSITHDQNQAIYRGLGYEGDVGNGDASAWLKQNPDKILQYTLDRRNLQPGYVPAWDQNTTREGLQTFNPDINKSIGSLLGYSGTVGRGELGSGQVGVDYLSLLNDPEAIKQYESYRQIFNPEYKWSAKNVAPEGWNEQDYLRLNPDIADMVNKGQYITGLQQYILEGKGQGRKYNDPYSDFLTQLQGIMNQQTQNQSLPSSLDTPTLAPIKRPDNTDLPATLAYLQDMDNKQRRSAIATDAVYGMGADKGSQDYYLKLLLNNDMNDSGDFNMEDILPVENQYLASMGLNTSGNGSDFLTSLQRAYGSNFL